MSVRVEIEGLTKAIGSLRTFERRIPGMVREVESESAQRVASAARLRVPSGPAAGGHAAGSVRSTGSQVVAGGTRFPYFPWLDFGGSVGRNNSVNRRFIRSGRYIWRSFAENKQIIEGQMEDAVVETGRSSGLGVNR